MERGFFLHVNAELIFYGGTALCRTILDGTRVSEDVDLLHADPEAVLEELANTVPRALRREFPRAEFDAPTRTYKGPEEHPLVPDASAVSLKRVA